MTEPQQIRAVFDAQTITVYQAFRGQIAEPAVAAQRFVPPFSVNRTTWIKPSFGWMMYRSGWAKKPGQEHILAVRIRREAWESALDDAVLTTFSPGRAADGGHADREAWQRALEAAPVRVQWDPERSLRGGDLPYRSIQVGLTRMIAPEYNDWIVAIDDITPLVHRVHAAVRAGRMDRARQTAPRERLYPVPENRFAHLGLKPA